MCRIAAFPPGFSREVALEVLTDMEGVRNIDGTGVCYVKNKQFVIDKAPRSFSQIIKDKPDEFLSHMPYNDGWTIVHLRAASHGEKKRINTHPFVAGPWALIHNGAWKSYKMVKLALTAAKIQMKGDTDSEVAAHLWNIGGPRQFANVVHWGGVFMGLNLDGHLWVVKATGDLRIKALNQEKIFIASEISYLKFGKSIDALYGWYHFGPDGKYIKHHEIRENSMSGVPYNVGQFHGGAYRSYEGCCD